MGRLGHAGVARGDGVRLHILTRLPGPGAPEPCGWCTRCPVLWLGMARMSVTDVVGDVHVQAEFAVDVTRTGGVAVVSTRTAVWVEMVVLVLPSGVPLESSRTATSEEPVLSSWCWWRWGSGARDVRRG